MNSVQMHLALTHVPVILSLVGLIMLAVAFFVKNSTLTKTSYVLILIAGVAAIPVFFTGESAEDAIENLPGISEAVIEKHEDVAKLAMISIAVAGLAALAALFSFRWQIATRVFKVVVLLITIASGGLMAQTAHLGGKIRHTEIRSDVVLENGNKTGEHTEGDAGQQTAEQHDNNPAIDNEDKVVTIPLNNGAKWKADEATKRNVAAMVHVITDSTYADAGKRKQLYTNLKTKIDTLVRECSMKGAEHDALHVWLEKVLKNLKELKDDDDEYNKVYAGLKKDIANFYQSFD